MQTYGGVEIYIHLIFSYMEVTYHLHVPTALPPREKYPMSNEYEVG
jgi:hypothetical protein